MVSSQHSNAKTTQKQNVGFIAKRFTRRQGLIAASFVPLTLAHGPIRLFVGRVRQLLGGVFMTRPLRNIT